MKNAENGSVTYRSGVNLTMSCQGHLAECWVSTQPITNLNVGQASPDNRGCSLLPLRSLAHKANFSAPLAGEVRRSRVGGLLKNISTTSEKVKARMRGCSLFNLINPSPALWASSPARGEENIARGFTLIELLVVVLIIGILAAVALPQYQRAVEKSHVTQALVLVRSIANAQEVFFLDKGRYATSFDELDLEFPETRASVDRAFKKLDHFSCRVNHTGGSWGVPYDLIASCSTKEYSLFVLPQNGKIYCYVDSVGLDPKGICRQLSHGIKEGRYYVVQ